MRETWVDPAATADVETGGLEGVAALMDAIRSRDESEEPDLVVDVAVGPSATVYTQLSLDRYQDPRTNAHEPGVTGVLKRWFLERAEIKKTPIRDGKIMGVTVGKMYSPGDIGLQEGELLLQLTRFTELPRALGRRQQRLDYYIRVGDMTGAVLNPTPQGK